jgi:Fe-S cluster assembly protein SufD
MDIVRSLTPSTQTVEIGDGNVEKDFYIGRDTTVTYVVPIWSTKPQTIKIHVHLVETGASVNILGVVMGEASAETTLLTLQHHGAPETNSNLLVKTVLSDHAVFHYHGIIRVDEGAQKTDAYQRNENMLLSANTHAETKPGLEILANDVRCTHGATIGSIPPEQLWYLASRGISKSNAKKLITQGFLSQVTDKIQDAGIKETTQQFIQNYI